MMSTAGILHMTQGQLVMFCSGALLHLFIQSFGIAQQVPIKHNNAVHFIKFLLQQVVPSDEILKLCFQT